MFDFWFGVMGAVAVLVGIAITAFNRQFAAFILPVARRMPGSQGVLDSKLYKPLNSGRVPILMIIGVGWIIIGGMFVYASLTGQV